jgi:hypothetical protein
MDDGMKRQSRLHTFLLCLVKVSKKVLKTTLHFSRFINGHSSVKKQNISKKPKTAWSDQPQQGRRNFSGNTN